MKQQRIDNMPCRGRPYQLLPRWAADRYRDKALVLFSLLVAALSSASSKESCHRCRASRHWNFRSLSFRGSTAPSDSTSHHTPVDIVDRASRPAGLIRQKEHDVVGEILRPAYATDRVKCIETLGQGLLDLVRIDERIEEWRHGHSGRHRVYPDPVTTKLHREILGEGVQASLLHRICRRRSRLDRLMRPHRADVDDRPATVLHHVSGDGLRDKKECAIEIHIAVRSEEHTS